MSTDFTDDLEDVFDLAEFAVEASVGASTFPVIFDDEFRGLQMYDGQVESTGPQALVRDSDATEHSITTATAITINEVAYTVTSAQPQGDGTTVLFLTKV